MSEIEIVTLDRPERRNALSIDLMLRLTERFRAIGEGGARAVILAAEGKVFSSGHDLGELVGRSLDDYRRLFDACVVLMETIQSIPQPVIAEVQGLATAAGCQLAATCDLVVASEAASFATPGVRIGLFCTTPMVALTRAVGRKRAMEMLLTGRAIDALTAADWGLANRVVPADALRAASLELAGQIAEASGSCVGIGKRAFYAQVDLEQARAYEVAKEIMSNNAAEGDAQEGIGAFLAKRKPRWRG
jgi:enoyl-CoA hydratase/carnithine racemase